MGMFTSIIHPEDGRELQIKTGDDDLEQYKVGDTVNWYFNKERPGEGNLLDGVYHAISNIGEKYVYDWVLIKNHIIKEIIPCSDDVSYIKLIKRYNIKAYDKKWWSQKQWRDKRKRDRQNTIEYNNDMNKYLKEINYEKMSKEEKLGAMIAYPIRRMLNYTSVGRKLFKVEPLPK